MDAYSPDSTSSRRSIKPSLSPSLSPRKDRAYDSFLDAPSIAGSDSGPSTSRPYIPEGDAVEDMELDHEDQMTDEEAYALAAGVLSEDPEPRREDENGLYSGTPEEADEGSSGGWKCAWARCGRVWKSQSGLVKHVHQDHIGINKEWYTCKWDECRRKGDRQATRHALVTHIRAHTGERPYTCPQPNCTKTFTRSDAMNKHLRSIHSLPAELANPRLAHRAGPKNSGEPPDFGADTVHNSPYPNDDSRRASPMDETIAADMLPHPSQGDHPPHSLPPRGESAIPEIDMADPQMTEVKEETDKPKAKPRPRATSGKKPAAPRAKKTPNATAPQPLASASSMGSGSGSTSLPFPSPLQPPVPEFIRPPTNPHLDTSSVTIGPDGSTYVRFGSDADLMTDPDLYDVLPRVRNRPGLQVTQEDLWALEYVRKKYPRKPPGVARKAKGGAGRGKKKAGAKGEDGEEGDGESDDSFDEGTSKVHADESHLEIGRIGEPGIVGERSVFGRSRWAAKYIMAKAKLMLADEEMRMRLGELHNVLDEEEGLLRSLEVGQSAPREVDQSGPRWVQR